MRKKNKNRKVYWKIIAVVEAGEFFQLVMMDFIIRLFSEKSVQNEILTAIIATQVMALIICIIAIEWILKPLLVSLKSTKTDSERDELTGIYNLKKFDRSIEFYNSCDSLGIVFVDINDLKKANDVYGHKCGDELIFKVAKVLESETRKIEGARVYRIGGDEFLIGLPNLSRECIFKLKPKLIEEVSKIRLELSNINPSIAVGVAFENSVGENIVDVEHLKKKADKAMYLHKKKIKNNR